MNALKGDVKLLTVEEAAAALSSATSVSFIRRMCREGKLVARRFGKRYLIHPAELERFARCPDPESRPASGNTRTGDGSSSTPDASTPPDALGTAIEDALKLLSPGT